MKYGRSSSTPSFTPVAGLPYPSPIPYTPESVSAFTSV